MMAHRKFALLPLTVLLFFSILTNPLIGQSVTISAPSEVEVGYDYDITATFSGPDSLTVVSYDWDIPWIGDGVSGQSGLSGDVQYNGIDLPSSYVISTNSRSVTIKVKWGDFYNGIETEKIDVVVEYQDDGSPKVVHAPDTYVNINRVCAPTIIGPSNIQKCCTETVEYCALSVCSADQYDWNISGGTIVSGQGTSCIQVEPANYGAVNVACTVSRQSGHPDYTRNNSLNSGRYNPATPSIVKPEDFICTDSIFTMSVPEICGMDHISWTLSEYLEIVGSNSDSTIIQVKVTPSASIASHVAIGAETIMNNNCNTLAGQVRDSLIVYLAETPPVPQGTITLESFPEGEEDPCKIQGWDVIFNATNPYSNGETTINPISIPNLPHRYGQDSIDITVCYINNCAEDTTCTVLWVDEPDTCDGELFPRLMNEPAQPVKLQEAEILKDAFNSSTENTESLIVFPNPVNDRLNINIPGKVGGKLDIINVHGIKVYSIKIEASESTLDLSHASLGLRTGVYFVIYRTLDKVYSVSFIKK